MPHKQPRFKKIDYDRWVCGEYAIRRRQCDGFSEYLPSGPGVRFCGRLMRLEEAKEYLMAFMDREP